MSGGNLEIRIFVKYLGATAEEIAAFATDGDHLEGLAGVSRMKFLRRFNKFVLKAPLSPYPSHKCN